MRISDGRINQLSRKIAKSMITNGILDSDLDGLAKEIRRGMTFFLQKEEVIDQRVREKIVSLKRGVPEGSAEWGILYRQYYNEEIQKM